MSNVTQKRNHNIYMLDGGPGRQYIGVTRNLKKRIQCHRDACRGGKGQAIYRAVRDDPRGWAAFPLRILMTADLTKFQARVVEVWFIAFHDTFNNGLNETRGGAGSLGYVRTQESCDKQSAATKGRPKQPFTAEHRANLSAAKKGKSHLPKHRTAISASHIGKKHSQETKDKMSASAINRTPEYCAKMSAAKKGKPRNNKMRDENIDLVMGLLAEGKTQRGVAREIGVNAGTIQAWVRWYKRENRVEKMPSSQSFGF